MKAPLFHVGQAVVMLATPCHCDKRDSESYVLPIKGKIYHVADTWLDKSDGYWCYFLSEYEPDACVDERLLAPVEEMPAEAYAELLEALEPVTA